MAKRPQSTSTARVRDVRAAEATRSMRRGHVALMLWHVWAIAQGAPRDRARLAEDAVWLPIRDAFLVLILIFTGMRRFEACRAACGEIDLAAARLWVTGKRNIKDYVPLPAPALRVLADWLDLKRLRGESVGAEAPLIAATSGGFMSVSALRLRWKRMLAAAGVPTSYGVHASRHAAGLIVWGATQNIEKTARFLRHRDTRVTTRHYLHVDADDLRAELGEAFAMLLTEGSQP